jgi:hypothetical protein
MTPMWDQFALATPWREDKTFPLSLATNLNLGLIQQKYKICYIYMQQGFF